MTALGRLSFIAFSSIQYCPSRHPPRQSYRDISAQPSLLLRPSSTHFAVPQMSIYRFSIIGPYPQHPPFWTLLPGCPSTSPPIVHRLPASVATNPLHPLWPKSSTPTTLCAHHHYACCARPSTPTPTTSTPTTHYPPRLLLTTLHPLHFTRPPSPTPTALHTHHPPYAPPSIRTTLHTHHPPYAPPSIRTTPHTHHPPYAPPSIRTTLHTHHPPYAPPSICTTFHPLHPQFAPPSLRAC